MNKRFNASKLPKLTAGACMLLAASLLGACSGSGGASSSTSPATASNVSEARTSASCGTSVAVGPSNPSGIYQTLPAALKSVYVSLPYALNSSVWVHHSKVKGPWKIGYIAEPIASAYQQDVLTGLQADFAMAKTKGLVEGSLITNVPATQAASTPEQQISAIEQMVSQGVNAIVLENLGGASEAPAIDAAGRAGVPVILADSVIPQSRYAIGVWSQNQLQADAGTLGIIRKGNILILRGIPGNPTDAILYNQAIADLRDCPNIHVAASMYGNWVVADSKTAVEEYLVSHPQPIAGVIQDGGQMASVIEAFQSQGRSIPPISDGECQGGDLSWWLAHRSTYRTVGGCFNGFQGAYTYFNVALRVLNGDGPKFNVLEMPAPVITNTNVATYATPDEPLTWSGEQRGPVTAWCDASCLDAYFNTAGTPGGS